MGGGLIACPSFRVVSLGFGFSTLEAPVWSSARRSRHLSGLFGVRSIDGWILWQRQHHAWTRDFIPLGRKAIKAHTPQQSITPLPGLDRIEIGAARSKPESARPDMLMLKADCRSRKPHMRASATHALFPVGGPHARPALRNCRAVFRSADASTDWNERASCLIASTTPPNRVGDGRSMARPLRSSGIDPSPHMATGKLSPTATLGFGRAPFSFLQSHARGGGAHVSVRAAFSNAFPGGRFLVKSSATPKLHNFCVPDPPYLGRGAFCSVLRFALPTKFC